MKLETMIEMRGEVRRAMRDRDDDRQRICRLKEMEITLRSDLQQISGKYERLRKRNIDLEKLLHAKNAEAMNLAIDLNQLKMAKDPVTIDRAWGDLLNELDTRTAELNSLRAQVEELRSRL